jgi:hypothetical protein
MSRQNVTLIHPEYIWRKGNDGSMLRVKDDALQKGHPLSADLSNKTEGHYLWTKGVPPEKGFWKMDDTGEAKTKISWVYVYDGETQGWVNVAAFCETGGM